MKMECEASICITELAFRGIDSDSESFGFRLVFGNDPKDRDSDKNIPVLICFRGTCNRRTERFAVFDIGGSAIV